MGGVNDSRNFILNCEAWHSLYKKIASQEKIFPQEKFCGEENPFNESENLCYDKLDNIEVSPSDIGIAPVTGAVQNIGFKDESDFYLPYFQAAFNQNISICVGDGAPDEKLKFGLEAVKKLKTKAFFFLKPYPNEKILERIDWISDSGSAIAIGMDIDAYNIVTMRNQANLERKSVLQINEIRKYSRLPLMLKGIFTDEDIKLCQEVKPEIAVVSNHGGRVETREGSSAEFLEKNISALKKCCSQVWVDGGLRTKNDIKVAKFLGTDKILIARSFISSLCLGGREKMEAEIKKLF